MSLNSEFTFFDISLPGTYPIISIHWVLSDGSASNLPTFEHTFTSPGEYLVTLTVIDAVGEQASTSQSIAVNGQTFIFTSRLQLSSE
jgi:PKD repeat protein